MKRVDTEKREVDIHWEDDDKGTISFEEVYIYPTEKQVADLQEKIATNSLDPKMHVFASRTNLALSGRCGPVRLTQNFHLWHHTDSYCSTMKAHWTT